MDRTYPNLCRELNRHGISNEFLAERLNLSERSLLEKLRGDSDWTLSEVIHICKMVANFDIDFLFCSVR